ncbi:MAG: hypothetical protein ABIY47_01560 [Opitutaceae bacterium]
MSHKPRKSIHVTTNMWAALRDVLIHSLTKGQFPFAVFAGLIALALFRMPSADVTILANKLIAGLYKLAGLSYAANVGLVCGWFFHARWQRRLIAEEMARIGREKTTWQEQKLGLPLSTAKKALK